MRLSWCQSPFGLTGLIPRYFLDIVLLFFAVSDVRYLSRGATIHQRTSIFVCRHLTALKHFFLAFGNSQQRQCRSGYSRVVPCIDSCPEKSSAFAVVLEKVAVFVVFAGSGKTRYLRIAFQWFTFRCQTLAWRERPTLNRHSATVLIGR